MTTSETSPLTLRIKSCWFPLTQPQPRPCSCVMSFQSSLPSSLHCSQTWQMINGPCPLYYKENEFGSREMAKRVRLLTV